jgi:hypothetical protein
MANAIPQQLGHTRTWTKQSEVDHQAQQQDQPLSTDVNEKQVRIDKLYTFMKNVLQSVSIKTKAIIHVFSSTFGNENSRPRAKRRNTTPNCAKVSTWVGQKNLG